MICISIFIDTDLRVPPDIMHVTAQQVAQAVGHEDGSQADPHHVLHVALDDAHLQQLLQVSSVRQQVHVSPLHTGTCRRPPCLWDASNT